MVKKKSNKLISNDERKKISIEIKDDELQERMISILSALQQKVLASSALNGGFDTLMFKIDKLEESQASISEKVNSIHDAIYHPDNGLFARVKTVEQTATKVDDVVEIEKNVSELLQWQRSDEKQIKKGAAENVEQDKKIEDLMDQVEKLTDLKKKVFNVLKYSLVTLITGMASIIGKVLYDLINGHITFH